MSENYNKTGHNLRPLNTGDVVRMKTPNKPWEKGVVTSEIDSRSYEVQTESGGTYRHNRCHLRKYETDFHVFESGEFQMDIPIPPQNNDSVPVAVNNNSAPISDDPNAK
jgi:hypothetical protein